MVTANETIAAVEDKSPLGGNSFQATLTNRVFGIPTVQWIEEQFSLPFACETRESFERVVGEIADLKVRVAEIQARQASRVSELQTLFAPTIEALQRKIGERLESAYSFAARNEASVFGDEKSLGLPLADVSFKNCPPCVEEAEGWKTAGIIEALKKWFRGRKYLRVRFEINKRAILADRENVKGYVWARRGLIIAQNKVLAVTPRANPYLAVSLVRPARG